MPQTPKLKIIKPWSYPPEQICELEQAQYFLFSYGPAIEVTVDKQVIHSYDEMVALANKNLDKEFIPVEVSITCIPGG